VMTMRPRRYGDPMQPDELENLLALFEFQRNVVLFGGRPTELGCSTLRFLGERVLRESLLYYGASAPDFLGTRHLVLDSMHQAMARMDRAEAIEAATLKLAGDASEHHLALDRVQQAVDRMEEAIKAAATLKLAGDPVASADAPGPKPGRAGIARPAWEIALHILDGPDRPPKGYGRLAELSRRVVNELAAQGFSQYEVSSITREIGKSVRDWEAKHPDL
jgi:hypothetical protein